MWGSDEVKINEERQSRKEGNEEALKQANFFAVRTTAGQELNVLLMLEVRVRTANLPIHSIFSLPDLKGYIVVEASGLHVVYEAIRGLKHIKGKASGTIKWGDIESLLKPKSLIELLKEGEEVEIIAGPFRGMKARVVAVDKVKNEVSLSVLEASYPLTITIPVDYIKQAKKGE
jgi:transcriptional antiterminator NusG|uniref:Transcription elongation factor Spt5 n=1 Tax=Ignisphaera aggregans TaxID=334771 RepID=A0A7J2U295_9CREN